MRAEPRDGADFRLITAATACMLSPRLQLSRVLRLSFGSELR
jgi:hypothetical protein